VDVTKFVGLSVKGVVNAGLMPDAAKFKIVGVVSDNGPKVETGLFLLEHYNDEKNCVVYALAGGNIDSVGEHDGGSFGSTVSIYCTATDVDVSVTAAQLRGLADILEQHHTHTKS
jgi:methenyltetrahydromethanopterin cyclohydrolase